ncbi:hypothetical protein RJ639_042626 [Escallonia herrerae]|uniref:Alcohol dehydrogenase-like N-terminal domain-containing protein n=1 Tax=Escallonia herrerae TaxID=1293975 RepID=A0AA88WDK1_9ASTE|nr:hypothetical protein RJ639_042626 [Escallonia herrerae]
MAKSPETEHPVKAFGWAARDTSGTLSPFNFSRRATGDEDVKVKVLYCGICHSDLHSVRNERGNSQYPMVPGHEIVGIVMEVGSKVQKFKVGDKVGIGCMVGSCRSCNKCTNNLENQCRKMVLTYRSTYFDGTRTYGGYSDIIVANEHFIAAADTMDGIIDTVSAVHTLLPLLGLLKSDGKLVLLGSPKALELPVMPMLAGRKMVAGSGIGGMKETQEMIDFCAKHNITADVEIIPMDYVNTAMDRLAKADVRYRFVIDVGNTLKAASLRRVSEREGGTEA